MATLLRLIKMDFNRSREPRLSDTEFDRRLTLGEAYRILIGFVAQYHERGETSTLDLLSAISLDIWRDGGSADPAQLDDFLSVAVQVLGDRDAERLVRNNESS